MRTLLLSAKGVMVGWAVYGTQRLRGTSIAAFSHVPEAATGHVLESFRFWGARALLTAVAAVALLLVPGARPGSATCVNPPADLVAWWPLDETAGLVAFDVAGMHNGNQMGTIASVPGMVGGAYRFKSGCCPFSGGLVRVANKDPFINVGTSDFTIDAWINPDQLVPGQEQGGLADCPFLTYTGGRPRMILSNRGDQSLGIPGFSNSVGVWFYIRHLSNDPSIASLGVLLASSAAPSGTFVYQTSSEPILMGQWQHVAVTVARNTSPPNPPNGTFYVNGAQVGSSFILDPSLVSIPLAGGPPSTLDIGHGDAGRNLSCCVTESLFEGAIDELEIFSRALSDTEIHGLWAAGSAGKCKTPLDHLKCYDIKDDLKLKPKPIVDLDSPQFGLEPGCRVEKATKFCVPVRKTVSVEPSTGLEPISGQGLLDDRICYEIKCDPPFPADQRVQDQFGTRVVRKLKAFEMCTPARKVPRCGNGLREGTEECDGGPGCNENCTLERAQFCPAPPTPAQ